MKTDKHGYKINNFRRVSGATVDNLLGSSQISYNMATGELFADWHPGSPGNNRTIYSDPSVITIAFTNKHMTMQEIADAVYLAAQKYEAIVHADVHL